MRDDLHVEQLWYCAITSRTTQVICKSPCALQLHKYMSNPTSHGVLECVFISRIIVQYGSVSHIMVCHTIAWFACQFMRGRIMLRRFISYHIISYHIISYHIISYHIISYHIISYHIISYHIISYHIISYHIISYHIISYHIISYHIISYHIISYHIISYHIISYHVVCHDVAWHRMPASQPITMYASVSYGVALHPLVKDCVVSPCLTLHRVAAYCTACCWHMAASIKWGGSISWVFSKYRPHYGPMILETPVFICGEWFSDMQSLQLRTMGILKMENGARSDLACAALAASSLC